MTVLSGPQGRPRGRRGRPGSVRTPPIRGKWLRSRHKSVSQSPAEAVRTPSPYLRPYGKPVSAPPRRTLDLAPSLDEYPSNP